MGFAAAVAVGVIGLFVGLSSGGVIAGVFFSLFLFGLAYGAFVWNPETLRRNGQATPPTTPVSVEVSTTSTQPAAYSQEDLTRRISDMLAPLGLSEAERKTQATTLVAGALADVRDIGLDATSTTRPNLDRASTSDLPAHMAAGLTAKDIDDYWGRSLLAVVAEAKVREYLFFIWMDIARQTGQDLTRAKRQFQAGFPHFLHPLNGEPEFGESTLTRFEDKPLFPEFSIRVTEWHRKLTEAEVDAFVAQYGSVNAAARAMINEGRI